MTIDENFRKECENYTLAEKYRAFSNMYDEKYNERLLNYNRRSLLQYRTIKGYCKEEIYEKTIKELGKTHISNFDILFTDWVYIDDEIFDRIISIITDSKLCRSGDNILPDKIRYDFLEEDVAYQIPIGSATSHGLHNHDDPYIDNLRSSNIAPYGNQQVNITQPNPSTQNYGDEVVPYEFNFTRQRFTSPEEVLNHVMRSDQQNVNPIYQQPCYIDQWGNVIYYNPQSY